MATTNELAKESLVKSLKLCGLIGSSLNCTLQLIDCPAYELTLGGSGNPNFAFRTLVAVGEQLLSLPRVRHTAELTVDSA